MARQPDLFGDAAPRPRPAKAARQARAPKPEAPGVAAPQPGAAPGEFAARATPAELDELVHGLPDEGLAHLVLAGVRVLRRRLAREGAARARGRKGRAGALERAAERLQAELGRGEDI